MFHEIYATNHPNIEKRHLRYGDSKKIFDCIPMGSKLPVFLRVTAT